MSNTIEKVYRTITDKANDIRKDIIDIRRDIYMHPELSGNEKRTSRLVADKLHSLGLDVQTNIGGYGVIGILNGKKPGKTIAWRADMDACAMQDVIEKPYKSKIDGIKHVCGHDAHTAIGLGIAETLSSIKDQLSGTVKFIFQPWEEGLIGASRMINDGALEKPRPDAVYGLHVTNWGPDQTYLKAGQLTVNYGAALFGKYLFKVTVKLNRENINLSTEQEIVIRHLKQLNKYNINCEKSSQNIIDLNIDGKDNIFKDNTICLIASFRVAQIKFIDEITAELNRIISQYEEASGYQVNMEPLSLMPPVYNDEKESEEADNILQNFIGDNAIPIRNEFPPHGKDDFALFQNEIKHGLFFFIGMANLDKGIKVGMHNPDFDIDEDCLEFGVRTMSMFLYEILSK